MKCARIDDCPRARCAECNATDCPHFITPEHYDLLVKADSAYFRGFVCGVVISVIVFGLLVWTKGV